MIVHLTPENLRTELVDTSFTKPVLACFYAHALEECKDITARLSALVGDNNTYLTLAFVDMADPQLQGLAIQLGLQALPAVVVFKDGRPVDALMGLAQLEGVGSLIEKYQPKQEEILLTSAHQALSDGDNQLAYQYAQQAFNINNARSDIKLLLARSCLELKRLDQAKELLITIPMVDQDSEYQSLLSALDLAQQAAESPEIKALEQRLASNPHDNNIKEDLAIQYSQAGRKEEALDLLFEILKADINSGNAKKVYLDILATMPGDSITARYRRQIYSLLY
jgi:Thioredoxin domain-containing protein